MYDSRQDMTADERRRMEEIVQTVSDATADLAFDEKTHTYNINGRVLTGVSEIVGRLSQPFDEEKQALRSSQDARSAWYGMKPEDIIDAWHDKRDAAANLGTQTHAYAETLFRSWTAGTDIELPETPQQNACMEWWKALDPRRWIPVLKETPICDPIRGYAGTPDLLLYDRATGRLALRDWKTNENLLKKAYGKMKPPATYLGDNAIGHYTVQQNLYADMLMKLDLDIEELKLVWLRPDGAFQEIGLQLIPKAITMAADTALSKYA